MSKQRIKQYRGALPLSIAVLVITGCGGIHSFDDSQIPVITVSSDVRPVISWAPQQAYKLDVYAGSEDGDGFTNTRHRYVGKKTFIVQ